MLGVTVTTPYFAGVGYIVYPRLPGPTYRTEFSLSLRPNSLDGLIFYSSQYGNAVIGDFISLGMRSSRVELRYNLGSSYTVLLSEPVELQRWHTVRVNRLMQAGQLFVDDMIPVLKSSVGRYAMLNVFSNLYIGGYGDFSRVSADAEFVSGFVGCIKDLEVYGG